MSKTCKTCAWFNPDPWDEYGGDDIGDCERFPPFYVHQIFKDNMKAHKTMPKLEIQDEDGNVYDYDPRDESVYVANQRTRVGKWQRCGEWTAKEGE